MVTSLPIEGLHCILDQLPHADLKTLRMTCQSLNNIVSPRLFATLIIDIRKRSSRRVKIALLEAIASHRTNVATFIESLEIHSLTPARYKPLQIWKHLTKKRVRSYYAFERAFITCIPYLVALKSVTFNFSPMRYIQPSSEDRIMRSLSSLPELRHVSILMHHRGINPSTPHSIGRHFKNISSLHIAGDASSYYGALPAVLISKSPMINAITVDSAWHVAISDIFRETSEPLSLKSLTVGPHSFKFFDDVSLISPHVECLSSLSIGSEATDVPKAFWQLLMEKKVAIQHLTVRRVDETFLCYLESYSGLLKLSLSPGEAAETDKDLASRFFRCALAKHADSLKSLRVCSPQEGPWCLGEDNFSDVVACPNLSALHIYVGQQGKPTNDGLNVITGLLESVQNEKLPLLKLLELEPATSRKSHDPNMNMYSPELVRGHHYINDSISKFCIVDPSHALRQLELSSGHMDNSRLVKWEENQWTFMLQTTVGGR